MANAKAMAVHHFRYCVNSIIAADTKWIITIRIPDINYRVYCTYINNNRINSAAGYSIYHNYIGSVFRDWQCQ